MAYIQRRVINVSSKDIQRIECTPNDSFGDQRYQRLVFRRSPLFLNEDIPLKVKVIGSDCTVGPFALEILFPILNKPGISPISFWS